MNEWMNEWMKEGRKEWNSVQYQPATLKLYMLQRVQPQRDTM